MRKLNAWIVIWMLYWIVLAAGTPSFFPDWVQSFTYGFGLGSAIFGCAYAYHVSLLRDDIKRLETKNTELEKQLQKEPTALLQTSPEPVSVVKISEGKEEASKLLPAEPLKDNASQNELKSQALKIANQLYRAIEEGKNKARQTTGGLEIGAGFLYKIRPGDFRDTQYKNIMDSILRYYSKHLHDTAVELKSKILVSEGTELLSKGNYTNPQGLLALEAIAEDLKNIASI
jgi:hypothetical protein